MTWIADPQAWAALITLTALEIVLGIDNIIFIAILAGKLPASQQPKGRRLGLLLAMISRIALLCTITVVMRLTAPLFTVWAKEISGRDLILVFGGLFLLAKSTLEIQGNLEGNEHFSAGRAATSRASFVSVVVQIMLLDIVFSLDSVITAIGPVKHLVIMIIAIVIAVIFMIVLADMISRFVEAHPTVKILALSFLLLIGVALIGEGLDLHIPKGYIYFAMAFSTFVEMLNLRIRKGRREPVHLHPAYVRRKGSAEQTLK